jgi:hypothetical protein
MLGVASREPGAGSVWTGAAGIAVRPLLLGASTTGDGGVWWSRCGPASGEVVSCVRGVANPTRAFLATANAPRGLAGRQSSIRRANLPAGPHFPASAMAVPTAQRPAVLIISTILTPDGSIARANSTALSLQKRSRRQHASVILKVGDEVLAPTPLIAHPGVKTDTLPRKRTLVVSGESKEQ